MKRIEELMSVCLVTDAGVYKLHHVHYAVARMTPVAQARTNSLVWRIKTATGWRMEIYYNTDSEICSRENFTRHDFILSIFSKLILKIKQDCIIQLIYVLSVLLSQQKSKIFII